MPKTFKITAPGPEADLLLKEVQTLPNVLSLTIQRQISISPPGDVLTVEISNRSQHQLMKLLEKTGISRSAACSVSTNVPLSVTSVTSSKTISTDTSESSWEEMDQMITRESHMTLNAVALMIIAGIICSIGLATNALHLVIGAMIIAPGFEPITRISLGLVAQGNVWKLGLADLCKGYLGLAAGAVAATFFLRNIGINPLQSEASYLPSGTLLAYWTSITSTSLVVSAVASAAGALLIATNRSVLTAGVMVALALVPSITIAGMGLALLNFSLALQGLKRFLIETLLVFICSSVVFAWKRLHLHRRRMIS